MKLVLLSILFLSVLAKPVTAQFYLRGEIKDEKGNVLPDVKINLYSKNAYSFSYKSGSAGTFGIPTNLEVDTIILSLLGYEPLKKAVNARQYQSFVLKMLSTNPNKIKNGLCSKTKQFFSEQYNLLSSNGESYSSLVENDFFNTSKYPETGFTLNIDRASYSNIRRFLNNGIKAPTNAVRIEEMLNYFDYKFDNNNAQEAKNKFAIHHYLTTCPWNNKSNLLFLHIKAPKLNLDTLPPSNLVFLIDVSGSMDKPNRLPLLQASFKKLVDNLRDIDYVTIVIYGGGVAKVLDATNGSEKEVIKNVIDSLSASGDTPGEAAIQTAYAAAAKTFIPGGNNRVILATDGDFNVGITSEKALQELITRYTQSGIYLTCLGVGMGNYKDSKLEILSKSGKGNFAYIDNLYEAEKVLVTEFTKTMYAVANDATLNISFNANNIKEYRLIGFDNRVAAIVDKSSELEGGEVGSAHSMIAIFELKGLENNMDSSINIGNIELQYKLVDNNPIILNQNLAINNTITLFNNALPSIKFATSVAMFGSLLKQSKYANDYDFIDIYKIASSAISANDYAKQEFIRLLQTAEKLYNPKKKWQIKNYR